MFDHAHFLFPCTEFIRIGAFPLWTTEGTHEPPSCPERIIPPVLAWRRQFFVGGLDSIDVYLLINARLRRIRGDCFFTCPTYKRNLSRWPVQAGQALSWRFASWGSFQKTTGMVGVWRGVLLISRDGSL